jgi:N-methylhydantoinase B
MTVTTQAPPAGKLTFQEPAADLGAADYEVIRHRLWSVNDEACITMMHASGSPVVHVGDFNVSIYTPDGDVAVIGTYYMIPVGTMARMVKEILARFGDDITEGDVFVCNDPFIAAAHQNDVQVVAPFFHDGRLAGWTGATAHEADVGGMEPGSWCPRAENMYQEGFRIPPSKIKIAGVLNQGLWDTMMHNSRLEVMLGMDMTAMLAANQVAQSRLAEVCDRYGADKVVCAMKTAISQSEAAVRRALRELPDGRYSHRDFIDHDGRNNVIYETTCVVIKEGDSLIVDLTDTSPQAPGFINATEPATLGSIAAGMLGLLGMDAPGWNEGVLKPVEVRLKPGSLLAAQPPAPVSASSVAAAWTASHAVIGAIGKMIAAHPRYGQEATGMTDGSWTLVNFGGIDRFGQPFGDMFLDLIAWGGGAYSSRDGVDTGGAFVVVRGQIQDVEMRENTVPVLYLWRRERADTGGPGRHRGGVSIEMGITPYLSDTTGATLATHGVTQPNCAGIFGGYPGSGAGYQLVRGSDVFDRFAGGAPVTGMPHVDGEWVDLEAKTPFFGMSPGDVLNVEPQGGGGYGDPLSRIPHSVAEDLRKQKISEPTAAEIYGVVLTGGAVDVAATEQLRRRMRSDRVSRGVIDEPAPAIPADATPLYTLGDSFEVVEAGGRKYFRCGGCHAPLGLSTEPWKPHAARIDLRPEEVLPLVKLDPSMAITQHACPSCGTSLDVEVRRQGEAPLVDVIIY